MIVTKDTKISTLINENEASIEAIATLNKNFRKLKNPLLRKMLAPRVSISDAAKIGNSSVEDILEKLAAIGFEIENYEEKETINNKNFTKNMRKNKIVEFDARPILEGGIDPFKQIMEKLKLLKADETLLIINTFEPVPLLNVLKSKGYEYEVERPEQGIVHTYLTKMQDAGESAVDDVDESNIELSFADAEKRFAGRMKEVDVRDLEMPMPMVSILEELEQLGNGDALYVHHKRLPQYLLPELENRNYKMVTQEIDNDNLKIIIFK